MEDGAAGVFKARYLSYIYTVLDEITLLCQWQEYYYFDSSHTVKIRWNSDLYMYVCTSAARRICEFLHVEFYALALQLYGVPN